MISKTPTSSGKESSSKGSTTPSKGTSSAKRTPIRKAINIKEKYNAAPASSTNTTAKSEKFGKGLGKEFADVTKENIQTLKQRRAEIDEQFDALRTKVEEIEGLSLADSMLVTRLNEVTHGLDILTTDITSFLNACKTVRDDLKKNKEVISVKSGTDQQINGLEEGIFQLNNRKNTLVAIIKEITKRLARINVGRVNLDGTTPVDWDDDPTLYENTSIGLGHLLIMKQTWKNDGYSLGDVEGSVVLQPMQIKQVASVDWSRRDVASRTEQSDSMDSLTNTVTRESDSQEIIRTALGEDISGSSKSAAKSSGFSVGASASGPIGPAIVGVSGGYQSNSSKASSSSKQNSNRDLASNALQSLRDKIQQSASSIRSQRNTVIQEVSQSESVSATSEVIVNYNRRHALTTMWFSINRHFVIEQELVDVQECLFFPLPMTAFDAGKIYRWRDLLKKNLLDKTHREAFTSIEHMMDEYQNVNVPAGRYCDEAIDFVEGEMTISFSIPRLPDPDETALNNAIAAQDSTYIDNAIANRNTYLVEYYAPFMHYLKKYHKPQDVYLNTLKDKEKAERDYVYQTEVVPLMVGEIVNNYLQLFANDSDAPLEADFTLVDKYENFVGRGRNGKVQPANERPLRVRFTIPTTGLKREEIRKLRLRLTGKVNTGHHDTTYEVLPDGARVMLHSINARYSTKFGQYRLLSEHITKDLDCKFRDDKLKFDEAIFNTMRLSFQELQEPRKEDVMKATRLISHLNQHIEHYHTILWSNMDNNRLFRLMDGYIAPNSGGRSVASVVESQPLGVIGNNLILKVVPGANLDPMYNIDSANGVTLLDHYKTGKSSEPFRITMKNPGLYGESILGKCESAETIDNSKLWKAEDLTIPYLPAQIQGITLDSRYQNPGNLQAKDFAAPMINMQTLTPDALKESALSEALQLMGKGDSFRDATGLAGTQSLVKNGQDQNTHVLSNAMNAANSAMQTGSTYALTKQKQDMDAYKALAEGANPQQTQALREAFMKSWTGNDAAVTRALDNSNELARKQTDSAAAKGATDTLAKVRDMLAVGSTVDEIKVNPDGSFEIKGMTNSEDGVKKWVMDNSETLLEIARKHDLKQSGEEDKNVCWAYALALTLFPAAEWTEDDSNVNIIQKMLEIADVITANSETADNASEEAGNTEEDTNV